MSNLTRNDKVTNLSVSADDIGEAAEFVVGQLQSLCLTNGSRGFTAPVLMGETFEMVDDVWTRVFHFEAEFLPGVE